MERTDLAPRARGWLACAALLFALASYFLSPLGPALHAGRRPLHVVAFDRSPSVERTRPDLAAWRLREVESARARAREERADFAVAVFAADRRWWLPPGDVERALPAPPSVDASAGSDLDGCLELVAAAALGSHRGGRLRMFSDGRATSAAPEASWRALAARGWSLERSELPPPALDDVAVIDLTLPERVEVDSILAVELTVDARWASTPAPGDGRRLNVRLEWGSAEPLQRLDSALELAAGVNRLRFDLGPAPAGSLRVEASVAWPGDPVSENDRRTGFVDVAGTIQVVGVVGDSAVDLRGLELSGRGVVWTFVPPDALVDAWARADVLATFDVDRAQLPKSALRAFLDRGGAWLDASGRAAIAAGDLGADGGVAQWLPLALEPRPRPARDLVILLDASASMEGAAFDAARSAAAELAKASPPQDRLWLVPFTRELGAPTLLRDSGGAVLDPLALASALQAPRAGGGTDVLGAIAQLCASRDASAPPMVALLLSDGRSDRAAFDGPTHRAQLDSARIELHTFAFGPLADVEFLASLASGPTRSVARVEDAAAVLRAFHAALDGEHHIGPLTTRDAASDGDRWSATLTSDLTGLRPDHVERVWRARASGDARVLWSGDGGEPILAWRDAAGPGGRFAPVVALAAPLEADWIGPAARDPRLVSAIVRALGRSVAARTIAPRATLESGSLVVRGLSGEPPARLRARLPGGAELWLDPPLELDEDARHTRVARLDPRLDWPDRTFELRLGDGAAAWTVPAPPRPAAEFDAPVCELPDLEGAQDTVGALDRQAEGAGTAAGIGWALLILGLGAALCGLWRLRAS